MQTTPMQEQLRLHILCGDDNHTGSNDSQDFSIGKASSTTVVTVTGAPFTYTGSAQTPATVSVTGAELNLTPTADYANNTNAGTATASYTLQEMITIRVLTTVRTLVLVKHHQQP
jgi:hypothetical protein